MTSTVEDPVTPVTSPTKWTRHQVAEHLGVSIATVRRMEGRALHPEIGAGGTRLFDVTEVSIVRTDRHALPVRKGEDQGEVAARVFELFRDGANLRRVVIKVRVHPRVVRELYAEWLVSLNEGEQRRRATLLEAEDRRERARSEREHRRWLRDLEPSQRG